MIADRQAHTHTHARARAHRNNPLPYRGRSNYCDLESRTVTIKLTRVTHYSLTSLKIKRQSSSSQGHQVAVRFFVRRWLTNHYQLLIYFLPFSTSSTRAVIKLLLPAGSST